MRDPHVRFCERHGRAISRAYSTAQKWVMLDGLTHETQPEDLAARAHGSPEA